MENSHFVLRYWSILKSVARSHNPCYGVTSGPDSSINISKFSWAIRGISITWALPQLSKGQPDLLGVQCADGLRKPTQKQGSSWVLLCRKFLLTFMHSKCERWVAPRHAKALRSFRGPAGAGAEGELPGSGHLLLQPLQSPGFQRVGCALLSAHNSP